MKTITLKDINRKSSFARIAEQATKLAKENRALVRFTMGPVDHRQTFVAGPNKSVHTLAWEWARSTAGQMVAKAQRISRVKKLSPKAALATLMLASAIIGEP